MSNNTLTAINLVLRIVAGISVVGMGVYLILNDHGVAGGWTVLGGIFLSSVSLTDKN